MRDKINFLEVIHQLNGELFDKFGETYHSFTYRTCGLVDEICFNDFQLWCSEGDERLFIESVNDYEPFLPYIKRTFNEYVDKIHSFKFKRVPKRPSNEEEDE